MVPKSTKISIVVIMKKIRITLFIAQKVARGKEKEV
jgi:hypothetical protein